jgi:hypothetical protein
LIFFYLATWPGFCPFLLAVAMVEFLVCVSRCIVTRALGVSKARSPSAFQWQWHPLVRENTNNKRLTLLYTQQGERARPARESDRSLWAAESRSLYILYARAQLCVCRPIKAEWSMDLGLFGWEYTSIQQQACRGVYKDECWRVVPP